MIRKRTLSVDLVIVGCNHGVYADKLIPFYNGVPMDEKELMTILGGGEIILSPVPNKYDEYAVRVFDMDMQPIGHLWSAQAPAMREKMLELGTDYLRAQIDGIDTSAGVIFAKAQQPLELDMSKPHNRNIDTRWAANIPEVLPDMGPQSLIVSMELLKDYLAEAKSFDFKLQHRIDSILGSLPQDLSANLFTYGVEVYNMMASSEIKEVQQLAAIVLSMYIKRGSHDQIDWWSRYWLPSFINWAADGDLLAIFQVAGYTQEQVKNLLDSAPCNLFFLYQTNKFRFAKRLLYSYLPKGVYDRLLTLLAVWELMKKEQQVEEPKSEKKAERKGTDELVIALKPIFFGDEDEARAFLDDIQGMKPKQVTECVKAYLRMKKISDVSCRRDLWVILHENGLYDKSESNWNKQIVL